jgi:hypothetical protein
MFDQDNYNCFNCIRARSLDEKAASNRREQPSIEERRTPAMLERDNWFCMIMYPNVHVIHRYVVSHIRLSREEDRGGQ